MTGKAREIFPRAPVEGKLGLDMLSRKGHVAGN